MRERHISNIRVREDRLLTSTCLFGIIAKDKALMHFGTFKIYMFNLMIFARAELMDPSLLPSLLCYLDLN